MIDAETLKMIKFEGFNQIFESNMAVTISYKSAYELTETIYERTFGHPKYSSYESFMETRRQNLAKIRAKKANILTPSKDK